MPTNPNLGDIATCALCQRPVSYAGAGVWDHTTGADHEAAPMTGREQGAIEALRMMMDEARMQRDRRRRNAERALEYRNKARRLQAHLDCLIASGTTLCRIERAQAAELTRHEEEIACLRTQLQDREGDLKFEYETRIKAENRIGYLESARAGLMRMNSEQVDEIARLRERVEALEGAIATHQYETSAGCEVDRELWQHIDTEAR